MRTLLHALVALLCVLLVVVLAIATWFFGYTSDLPDMTRLGEFAPSAPAVVQSPSGGPPANVIPAAQMGENFRAALRAAEGERAVALAISRSMFSESSVTHQRQLAELRIYAHLRLKYSSQDLYTIYANGVWFGEETSGVQDAAQHYLHKDPADLTVAEAAYLAGLIWAPYSLRKHPERALERRNLVLERMVAQGSLAPAQAKAAEAEPLPFFNRH